MKHGKQVPKNLSKHQGQPVPITRISTNSLSYQIILYMHRAYVVPIQALWLLGQTLWVPMSKRSFSVEFLALSRTHWAFTWKVSAPYNPLHQTNNPIQTRSNQIRKSPGIMLQDNYLPQEAGKRGWKHICFQGGWFGLIWISASVKRFIGVKKFHQIFYPSPQQ